MGVRANALSGSPEPRLSAPVTADDYLRVGLCASTRRGGGVCTHIPDAPNYVCGRVYQITEVRKLP